MKLDLVWSDKMLFEARAGEHRVEVDARPPIGTNQGMTPKELLLAALSSCTAMDVIALMKKHKQKVEEFKVSAEATLSEGGHPKTFTSVDLVFEMRGAVDPNVLLDSVRASETTFCGVSAMLSRAFPIRYSVVLNGTLIGAGEVNFGSKTG